MFDRKRRRTAIASRCGNPAGDDRATTRLTGVGPNRSPASTTSATAGRRPGGQRDEPASAQRRPSRLPPSAAFPRWWSGSGSSSLRRAICGGRLRSRPGAGVWPRAGLAADRRDARRRPVRVQLRRLGVPDAVSRPDHAALRGRAGDALADDRTPTVDLAALLAGRRVAVVGDVMLDHFLVGRVDRISPEAPVPVVRFEREEHRLGGAANVAHNVAALGGDRASRRPGRRRRRGARSCGTSCSRPASPIDGLVDDRARPRRARCASSRRATSRWRASTRRRTRRRRDAVDARCCAQFASAAADAHAIVLSDYRKGVITRRVIARGSDAAAARAAFRCSWIRRCPQAERYRGATLITPNHHEAELMTQTTIRTIDDARAAARRCTRARGASVIITLGRARHVGARRAAAAASSKHELPAVAREVVRRHGRGRHGDCRACARPRRPARRYRRRPPGQRRRRSRRRPIRTGDAHARRTGSGRRSFPTCVTRWLRSSRDARPRSGRVPSSPWPRCSSSQDSPATIRIRRSTPTSSARLAEEPPSPLDRTRVVGLLGERRTVPRTSRRRVPASRPRSAPSAFPAVQAAYVVGIGAGLACLLLHRRTGRAGQLARDGRLALVLLQLMPVAFIFRIRANHEYPMLLCLLVLLLGYDGVRRSWIVAAGVGRRARGGAARQRRLRRHPARRGRALDCDQSRTRDQAQRGEPWLHRRDARWSRWRSSVWLYDEQLPGAHAANRSGAVLGTPARTADACRADRRRPRDARVASAGSICCGCSGIQRPGAWRSS